MQKIEEYENRGKTKYLVIDKISMISENEKWVNIRMMAKKLSTNAFTVLMVLLQYENGSGFFLSPKELSKTIKLSAQTITNKVIPELIKVGFIYPIGDSKENKWAYSNYCYGQRSQENLSKMIIIKKEEEKNGQN